MPNPVVRSNLPDILVIEKILDLDDTGLLARTLDLKHNSFTLAESLAQAASFHARERTGLTRHTFLAEFSSVSLPTRPAQGPIEIRVRCLASSQLALKYQCVAVQDGLELCSAEIIIGLREYDNQFRKDILVPHYKRILKCLNSD